MKELQTTLLSFIILFISYAAFSQTAILRPGNFQIIAYDNIVDNTGSDIIVVKTMVDITQGMTFGVTDATYVSADDNWTFSGSEVPRVEFEYTSTAPIETATDIAFYFNPSSSSVRIYLGTDDISGRFDRNMIGDYKGLRHNASISQAYYYQGDWDVEGSQASLTGSLITGIAFGPVTTETPASILLFTSVISNPKQTSYGAMKCESVPFACGIPAGRLTEEGWDIKVGDATNNLEDLIKEGNYCDPNLEFECPVVEIDTICSSLCSDVIFIMDVSGSVSDDEFKLMRESMLETVKELEAISSASFTYAVTSFATLFEISIPTTNNASDVDQYQRPFSGGTDVPGAINYVRGKILTGDLANRGSCKTIIVLYTDSEIQGLTWGNYGYPSIYNDIKRGPYDAEVTVIRYQGDNDVESNPMAASISSKGIPYDGDLYPNPNDPQGEGGPRRFYPTSFSSGVPGLADDVVDCGLLSIDISKYCTKPKISWSASEGGELIYPNNRTTIEIVGPGTYTVTVECENNCEMKDEIVIADDGKGGVKERSSYPDRTRFVDGKAMTPGDYELYLAGDLIIEEFPDYQLSLFPNPTTDDINLIYNNDLDPHPIFEIYRSDGSLVRKIDNYHLSEKRTIDTQGLFSGLYYIRVITSADVPVQPFTIIK